MRVGVGDAARVIRRGWGCSYITIPPNIYNIYNILAKTNILLKKKYAGKNYRRCCLGTGTEKHR